MKNSLEYAVCVAGLLLTFSAGLALAGWADETGYALHGWFLMLGALWGAKYLGDRLQAPVTPQPLEYNDDIIQWGILACFVWGVIGFFVGDWLAWQLAVPALNGDIPWTNFGRLRPVHTTAVLLGALLGLGITPGPLLIQEEPDLFWGLAASMYVGNAFLLLLNLPLVGVFVRALTLPRWVLIPAVSALAFVAVYAVNGSSFDLLLMTGFGAVGFGMRRFGFPLAPVVLGLVLGPLMEKNLRRAMALSGGEVSVLFDSPIAVTLWGMAVLSFVGPTAYRWFRSRQTRG